MKPVHCRVRHDPEAGSYGDCLRACVASILEIDPPEQVPHFLENGGSGDEAFERLRNWLKTIGYGPFIAAHPGDVSLDELLAQMGALHPDLHYMLFGGVEGGDHVVVCKGGKIVWNPSWTSCRIIGPAGGGEQWQIVVLVKL